MEKSIIEFCDICDCLLTLKLVKDKLFYFCDVCNKIAENQNKHIIPYFCFHCKHQCVEDNNKNLQCSYISCKKKNVYNLYKHDNVEDNLLFINNNYKYDYSLSRIFKTCDNCKDNTEHVIIKKNPKKFDVVLMCVDCNK